MAAERATLRFNKAGQLLNDTDKKLSELQKEGKKSGPDSKLKEKIELARLNYEYTLAQYNKETNKKKLKQNELAIQEQQQIIAEAEADLEIFEAQNIKSKRKRSTKIKEAETKIQNAKTKKEKAERKITKLEQQQPGIRRKAEESSQKYNKALSKWEEEAPNLYQKAGIAYETDPFSSKIKNPNTIPDDLGFTGGARKTKKKKKNNTSKTKKKTKKGKFKRNYKFKKVVLHN